MYKVDLNIEGSVRSYRVGKVVCIGRNYAKHAAEMGGGIPSEPWVFLKPSSALIQSGGEIRLPRQSKDIHHEVELVALIGKEVKNVGVDEALSCVVGYAAGLDMTARDLQAAAKEASAPWTIAKGFDTFAPLGLMAPSSSVEDPQALDITLRVNGVVRQSGNTRDMIYSVAELVSYCSSCFTLCVGDLLFTGTPDGVGPVAQGDELSAAIAGLPELKMTVMAPAT